MQLSQYPRDQQVLLASWMALTKTLPVESGERIPFEASEALIELDKIMGGSKRSAVTQRSHRVGGVRYLTNPDQSIVHNNRRQVRGAKSRYALATTPSGTGLVAT